MSQLLEQIKVYDVECYPNLFMVTLYSCKAEKYLTYSIYPDKNIDQRAQIIKRFLQEDAIWCGYNNLSYDDAMINALFILCCAHKKVSADFIKEQKLNWDKTSPYYQLGDQWYELDVTTLDNSLTAQELTKKLHEYSQTLISDNKGKYAKKVLTQSIDLMEIMRGNGKSDMKSLKALGVNLKHDKLQDLPLDPMQNVEEKDFVLMEEYNKNDVYITCKLLEEVLPLIEMRKNLNEHYDNKVDLLTASRTSITKKVLTYYYREKLRELKTPRNSDKWKFYKGRTERPDLLVGEIVNEKIYFVDDFLKVWFDDFKQQKILINNDGKKPLFPSLVYDEVVYSFGLGGLHTDDKPAAFKATETTKIIDLDVTSYYPFSLINYELCPAHLDKNIFLGILKEIVDERVKYKKLYQQTGDKTYSDLQESLKIVINSAFGLTNDCYSWMYDPLVTYKCTVNNQLFMLMLVERFVEVGFKVLSVNTDGLVVQYPTDQLEKLRAISKQWSTHTSFTLEEAFYDKYLRRDINNYIAITTKGKKKFKGVFTPQEEKELLKAFKFPITTQALVDYFLYDKPVEETIRNCKDIYEFCFSQKVGKQFTNYLRKVERKEILRHGKHLEKFYVQPKVELTILEESPVQRTLRFFVSEPTLHETDEEELMDGYNDYYCIGYDLVKKKLKTGTRYEIVKDPEVKKCWWIIDLKTDTKHIDTPFSTKKEAIPVVKELNVNDDSGFLVGQIQQYIAGKFVTLFNDYFAVENFADYKIDYEFYIDLVQKEIDKIEENK
jgi:hypothetical protein